MCGQQKINMATGLFAIILVASCSGVLAGGPTCPNGTITAREGQPLVIDFGFRGSSPLFNSRYTKDGSPFVPDRIRTFTALGRISFTSVMQSDGGVYEFTARQNFRSTICLTG